MWLEGRRSGGAEFQESTFLYRKKLVWTVFCSVGGRLAIRKGKKWYEVRCKMVQITPVRGVRTKASTAAAAVPDP